MRLDLLGLEGSASLGWNLLPEIKTLIRNFTNDILDETAVRVSIVHASNHFLLY